MKEPSILFFPFFPLFFFFLLLAHGGPAAEAESRGTEAAGWAPRSRPSSRSCCPRAQISRHTAAHSTCPSGPRAQWPSTTRRERGNNWGASNHHAKTGQCPVFAVRFLFLFFVLSPFHPPLWKEKRKALFAPSSSVGCMAKIAKWRASLTLKWRNSEAWAGAKNGEKQGNVFAMKICVRSPFSHSSSSACLFLFCCLPLPFPLSLSFFGPPPQDNQPWRRLLQRTTLVVCLS